MTPFASIVACAIGLTGLGITLRLTHAPITRDCRRRGLTSKMVSTRRENRAIALALDTPKAYQFPRPGLSPAIAFQDLIINNANLGLAILGERDRIHSKGWYECDFSVPLTDSWTRLQKHLDPLQSYLAIARRPELMVHNDRLTLRVIYREPTFEWADLTQYLRADLGSSDTSLDYLTQFQRFRITGGSEAGKSPTAKNIALALGVKLGVRPILSNPQSYSNKNHWGTGFYVEATTHVEQYELIISVAQEVIDRGERADRKAPRIYVFDELDSTVAYLDDKEQKILKRAVLMIIKQASHQNICVLFLGQSSTANLLPGTTKSDWMSLVTIAIGSTGYDAIAKSPALTSKRRTEVVNRYELMMRKAELANRAISNKADWIRPAVVFDPTNVELVVLPAFT